MVRPLMQGGAMRVLLVEGAPGSGAAAESELVGAGHTVVGCEAADPSAPCRGLDVIGECPLDAGDVDVAVVARVAEPLAPSERGALCAARRRVPVVLTGDPRHVISFGPGTHLAGADLAATCEKAAASGAAHAAAIRRELLIAGVLRPEDVDDANPKVSFEVQRERGRLRLTVRVPDGEPNQAGIVKAAQEALRRFDQWATVIDVVVLH
jgi:hypothetical protein